MIEKLLSLQVLEQEMDRLRAEKQGLAADLLERQAEEALRRKASEQAKAKVEELERQHRDMDTNLKLEEERLRKSRAKSKELKTEYEVSAMQRQIDGSKRSASEMEEQLLKMMEEIEKAKKTLEDETQQWQAALASVHAFEAEVRTKTGELEGLILAKDEERKRKEAEVDKPVLTRYRFIRERKHLDAVVYVKEGACQGCYMSIPPQTLNEMLHKKQLFTCPNCNRLIYLEPPAAAAPAA